MTADPDTPDVTLSALAEAYWQSILDARPLTSTLVGEPGRDDRMPDESEAGIAATRARAAGLLRDLQALDAAALSAADRVTHAALHEALVGDLAILDTGLVDWTVDPLEGIPVMLVTVVDYQRCTTPAEGGQLLARWRAMGPYVDTNTANLRAEHRRRQDRRARAGRADHRHPADAACPARHDMAADGARGTCRGTRRVDRGRPVALPGVARRGRGDRRPSGAGAAACDAGRNGAPRHAWGRPAGPRPGPGRRGGVHAGDPSSHVPRDQGDGPPRDGARGDRPDRRRARRARRAGAGDAVADGDPGPAAS